MALFSRRKRADAPLPTEPSRASEPSPADEPSPPSESAPTAAPETDTPAVAIDAEPAASVGISVSTFRGVGASAPAAPRTAPSTPAPTPPSPGENALLRAALAALPETPTSAQILNVARQLLQGTVLLRVKGDARTLVSEGKDLPLAIATQGDAQFVLVYSSLQAMQQSVLADGMSDTSAMSQPVYAVLRHVLNGTDAGILIDAGSAPARVALTREILQRSFDDADPNLAIKSLLAAPRVAETAARVVAALPDVSLWIAANRVGETEQVGIAEWRSPEGTRCIEVFSHPLEVVALGRGDRPVKITATQLAAALNSDEALDGVLINPAGPWIRLTRGDLAPVLAPSAALG